MVANAVIEYAFKELPTCRNTVILIFNCMAKISVQIVKYNASQIKRAYSIKMCFKKFIRPWHCYLQANLSEDQVMTNEHL